MKNSIGAIEPFGHHVHLHHSALDAVAFANHHAQGAVTAVGAVRRHEQVAEVCAFLHVSVVFVNGRQEPLHLLRGVGNEYAQEVVAVPEAHGDSRADGVDVLEHRSELGAKDVLARLDLDVTRGHGIRDRLGDGLVWARHREVAEFFPGHFLRVARSGNQTNSLVGHPEFFVQVPSGNAVVFHHHALDGVD